MQEQTVLEKENFSRYTNQELFYYLLDNLVIPPDSEFKDWKYFKEYMLGLCEDFENRCYERFGMEETE